MAWWNIWEQPLFGAKEEENDNIFTIINKQQYNKCEEAKGRWVLCVLHFFCLGFVLWWVLFYYTFFKPIKFFITKNLVITYKLNNNSEFLLQK